MWCHFARRSECARAVGILRILLLFALEDHMHAASFCVSCIDERKASHKQKQKSRRQPRCAWFLCDWNVKPTTCVGCNYTMKGARLICLRIGKPRRSPRPIADDQRDSSWHWPRRTFTRNRNVACVQFGNLSCSPAKCAAKLCERLTFFLYCSAAAHFAGISCQLRQFTRNTNHRHCPELFTHRKNFNPFVIVIVNGTNNSSKN